MARALGDDAALAVALYAMGTRFNQNDSMLAEDVRFLEEAEALYERLGDDLGRADCLLEIAWVAWWSGELTMSTDRAHEARRLYTRRGDLGGIADCLRVEAQVARNRGEVDEEADLFRRAWEIGETLGAGWTVAWTSYDLGELAKAAGRFQEAFEWYADALERFAQLHHGWGACVTNGSWGAAARRLGDHDTARRRLGESLRLALTHHTEGSAIWMVESIGGLAADIGHPEQSARLHGAADERREERGLARPHWDTWYAEDRERLRLALGDDRLDDLLAEGAGMGWDAAITLARQICGEEDGPDRPHTWPENPSG